MRLIACWESMVLPLLAALLVSACERPFDRSPPGYVEACFGGIENWQRNWVCSETRQVVTLEGTEADWPQLARLLRHLAENEALELFDTSVTRPGYIRMLNVHVCSVDGLHLSVDDRVYEDARFGRNPGEIQIVLGTYQDSFTWRPLAERLQAQLHEEWKGSVSVRYPEPLGSRRALPDSVASCEEQE